jgi:hypothetical protein
VPAIEFSERVQEAAQEILSECKARGYRSIDAERLRSAVGELTNEIAIRTAVR